MSWDGFKHILGSYPGIKTKFNNYLNSPSANDHARSANDAPMSGGQCVALT